MKLISLFALASASVITANAGDVARAYYKVKINASATLQTDFDETTNAKVTTSNVIEALIDELGVPSSKASDFDIIACYVGDDDQVMDSATYYLARTRGPAADRYKVELPDEVFDTNGGEAVFKRVFSVKNSTVKVNVMDSFSSIELDTSMLYIYAEGLAKAVITIKDVDDEGDPYLSMVNNSFSGHHVVETETDDGVGTIKGKIAGVLKTSTFDGLEELFLVDEL